MFVFAINRTQRNIEFGILDSHITNLGSTAPHHPHVCCGTDSNGYVLEMFALLARQNRAT